MNTRESVLLRRAEGPVQKGLNKFITCAQMLRVQDGPCISGAVSSHTAEQRGALLGRAVGGVEDGLVGRVVGAVAQVGRGAQVDQGSGGPRGGLNSP